MSKLKVPSLQHLARNWKPDSGMISRDLVRLVRNPPFFNYRPVFSAAQDLLQFGQPLNEVLEGIRRAEKREKVRGNFLELVPLIADHFRDVRPDFVNPVSTRLYSIGPDLAIPFTPPLVYGVGGQLYFPWFSFWRQNPLRDAKLRLFVTLVDEVLRDDPDLESANFQILDFSCPEPGEGRVLSVQNTNEIEPLPHEEKVAMLEIFADGFQKARTILESEPVRAPREDRDEDDNYDDNLQPDLPF
jgi:hypothetical protein